MVEGVRRHNDRLESAPTRALVGRGRHPGRLRRRWRDRHLPGGAAGADGIRHPVQAGQGARWAAGEVHTTGADAGLTALAVEGSSLGLFEPEGS